MEFTDTQEQAIIKELGDFTVNPYEHYGLTVINTDSGEYAIGTELEADEAWEEYLDSYIEECIIPKFPESLQYYFDDDKWKQDAKYDGRGHSLASYDGYEIDIDDLVAFRIN